MEEIGYFFSSAISLYLWSSEALLYIIIIICNDAWLYITYRTEYIFTNIIHTLMIDYDQLNFIG